MSLTMVCNSCGTELPHTEDYFMSVRGKPGWRCRVCHREKSRTYYYEKRDEVLEKVKTKSRVNDGIASEKRDRVVLALKENPSVINRVIAEQWGVGEPFVSHVRGDLEERGEIPFMVKLFDPVKNRWRRRGFRSGDAKKAIDPFGRKDLVYFVQAGEGGPIKIGFSNHLKKRLENFEVCSPYELKVLYVLPGGSADEGDLHRRFAMFQIVLPDGRVKKEWFQPADELLQFIELMRVERPMDVCLSWDRYASLVEQARVEKSAYKPSGGYKVRSPRVNPFEGEGKKKCGGCGLVLPVDRFGKNRVSADGKDYRCRACSYRSALGISVDDFNVGEYWEKYDLRLGKGIGVRGFPRFSAVAECSVAAFF
jgi:hypothetical protein